MTGWMTGRVDDGTDGWTGRMDGRKTSFCPRRPLLYVIIFPPNARHDAVFYWLSL